MSLVAVYLPLWRRQADEAVLVQALGAVLAAGAAGLWAGGVDVPVLLPWLVAFVVLTIAGERLELARLGMGPNAGAVLVLLAVCVAVGVVASLLAPQPGSAFLGVTLAVLVAWLAAHDVARVEDPQFRTASLHGGVHADRLRLGGRGCRGLADIEPGRR